MILQHNECRVLTAENGIDALEKLRGVDELPDLIVSDIMMPKMDGYDFFKTLSESAVYCNIPFIFLTALDSPEDIRLGKMIGADDYLTKPINEDDLLATIAGKILRNKKNKRINERITQFFMKHKNDFKAILPENEKEKVVLVIVEWDDKFGPTLKKAYPDNILEDYPIESIGVQLFDAASTIYGQGKITKAEGVHINVENYKVDGYALFDSYPDRAFRGGQRDYMLAIIAPNISYFQTLKIKKILQDASDKIKQKQIWDIKEYREELLNILTHSSL